MNKKCICIFLIMIVFISILPVSAEELFESTDINVSCDGIFTPEALDIIRTVLQWIRVLAPCALVLLVAFDFGGAVLNQDKDALAKAVSKVSKRVIAMLGVIFAPTMVIALSRVASINTMLSSDPLCTNATGTAAKSKVREAQKLENPEYTWEGGIVHGNYGGSGSYGGGGNYSFGPGNSAKRSVKTVTINGRTYDMYSQSGLSDISYQSGNLAMYGCGPLAFASAVSGFNSSIGAYEAASLVKTRTFGGIKKALSSLGIGYSGPHFYNSNNRNESDIAKMVSLVRNHLAQGKPVIALVTGGNNGETKYATNNHFITLLGETSDGKVIISNCNTELGDLDEIVRYYLKGGRKGFLLVG